MCDFLNNYVDFATQELKMLTWNIHQKCFWNFFKDIPKSIIIISIPANNNNQAIYPIKSSFYSKV